MKTKLISVVLAVAVTTGLPSVWAQKFREDDPLWVDPDNISIPKPTNRPLSKTIDLLQKTFLRPSGGHRHAQNVNTLGEVPDSSWYTNRMSRRRMSLEALARGPDQGDGPDTTKPWLIIGAKTAGVTPGFRIRDARGDIYFIKFDPLYWPQMATSTEVISTKFFYALGYHVPENYLVHWDGTYTLNTGAEVVWDTGHKEPMSDGYIRKVLRGVPRRQDGAIQVVASKFLPGSPVGPFDFQGTRADDPNDIYPHQDRRELRGLSVFCAWLNHNDSDSVNTLDMFVTEDQGRQYVRHHLIDFGTTLGSGATQPHARRVGNEYYIDLKPAVRAALTLGVWDRPWRNVPFVEYRSVGRFESDYFQPQHWKPDYPNPAFEKMTPQDAFWATRIVLKFDDDALRAIVQTGKIDEPGAEDYLIRTLATRRDKIVRYHLAQINPLDEFHVGITAEGRPKLEFVNLGLAAGLAAECRYEYVWYRFDNSTEELTPLGAPQATNVPGIQLPQENAEYLMVRIGSDCPQQPKWRSEVDVYVRTGLAPAVVGVDRADPPK